MTTDAKALQYIKIIGNSAHHLANVIEDALDMSRLENNKFELNPEYTDIRHLIMDVTSIMEFQIQQKKL